ncbi:hypothetical protein SynPROS91_00950 [Synechococcus sp. PROS-9-1]|nr:hypothetical protein SynPROS91_00950 [Synechococcus sp. PROS-9-1]
MWRLYLSKYDNDYSFGRWAAACPQRRSHLFNPLRRSINRLKIGSSCISGLFLFPLF